jgi:tryptophan 2,3-dioxygenase
MDRQVIFKNLHGDGTSDYEIYLNTQSLFACQKDYGALCNGDELQFQIVHQVQELWMKLMVYTLLDIDEYIQKEDTHRVLTLFRRVHLLQHHMIAIFDLLDTMSPKDYQEIRVHLGRGSGQESPGFRTLVRMGKPLWDSFEIRYLKGRGLTVESVYHTQYTHGDAYMVAEALAEFDQLFQRFRYRHLQHIRHSIGLGAKSLKGRPVEVLEKGVAHSFFPQLWEIRNRMTNTWAKVYGEDRESIGSRSKPDP